MARFIAPANVQLRRAQLTLMLATLVPTTLCLALGIVLIATGRGAGAAVAGVLVLALCTTSLTGYILGSIFVSRGAMVARFQNDFLSSVSHELRTPLTSILMFLETLRDERLTDPAEKRQCLDLLDQEVRRLDSLVGRLLRLSQLQARRRHFARDPVRVADVVSDAMAAFDAATLSDKTPIEIAIERADELVVAGDREALGQAVSNLLINAWKYSEGDRRITIKARGEGKHVDIEVADNGPGIPKAEQRRIFDQFERGQGAIDGGQRGSGLGLAIVRAIVRGHRGRLELRSRPGHGSEFRIRLPRLRPA